MYNINNIDIENFYYNGQWSYNNYCLVANENGFQNYSLTPQLDIKTETLDDVDGEFVVSTRYNPRTFEIPLFIQDNTKIRKIASWLSSKTAKDFFFKGDRIKVKAFVDTAIDPRYFLTGSSTSLKFRASDPYYTEINPTRYVINKSGTTAFDFNQLEDMVKNTPIDYETFSENTITFNTNSFSTLYIYNDGNVDSKPLVKIYGTGNLTFGLNGKACTINSVSEYVMIDFKSFDVYKADVVMLGNFVTIPPTTIQDFNIIPEWNTVSCSDNVTKIEILMRSKWI